MSTDKKDNNVFALFETDKELESKGIIINYGAFKVRIARAGGDNKKFAKRLEALTKPYRRALATETLDLDLANDLIIQAFVDAVLLGWEGVTDREGAPIPYSKENALKLFRELPDFFADLREQASKVSLFRVEVQEEDAKN